MSCRLAVRRLLRFILGMVLALPCELTTRLDDALPYNTVLFPGTHNSGINLGPGTLGAGSAVTGEHPSEAHSSYQYIVMDQRLSIRDQLDQGIRVIDMEVSHHILERA